jgi:predicted CxxxxCH...CXXCH cytochrome family protein
MERVRRDTQPGDDLLRRPHSGSAGIPAGGNGHRSGPSDSLARNTFSGSLYRGCTAEFAGKSMRGRDPRNSVADMMFLRTLRQAALGLGLRAALHLALLAVTLGLPACSEVRDDATRPNAPPAAVHPQGWLDPAARPAFHGHAIREQAWDMSGCTACHGADYRGGITGSSCLVCHPATPEGCNVCHGNNDNAAPPGDIDGNQDTAVASVGAHQAHLRAGVLSDGFACATCHVVPSRMSAPGHLDSDGAAEISWSGMAVANGAVPRYESSTATCSVTYCHDGGRFGTPTPVAWNAAEEDAAACGTCHGLHLEVDTGHPPMPPGITCMVCHSTVVDADLRIVDTALHINGQADATCGTCHGLPPGEESGHPHVPFCSACHGHVVDENFAFVDESLHNNGQVDY